MANPEDEARHLSEAGRNLNVVSGAIAIYLLSGADLRELSLLGARMPLVYPSVVEGAAVLLLAWFFYQYKLVARKPWRTAMDALSQALKENRHMRAWWSQQEVHPDDREAIHRMIGPREGLELKYASNITYPKAPWMTCRPPTISTKSRMVLHRTAGEHSDKTTKVSEDRQHLISRWTYLRLYASAWSDFLFRDQAVSRLIVPQLVAVFAVALILFRVSGCDPAGLFGILPLAPVGRAPLTIGPSSP